MKCQCPNPKDAGKCIAEQRGWSYPFPDFFDDWCECDCHVFGVNVSPPLISEPARELLKRILEIEPGFLYEHEAEIWFKARVLGLRKL